jgi:hypothetical protein
MDAYYYFVAQVGTVGHVGKVWLVALLIEIGLCWPLVVLTSGTLLRDFGGTADAEAYDTFCIDALMEEERRKATKAAQLAQAEAEAEVDTISNEFEMNPVREAGPQDVFDIASNDQR